MPGPGDVRGGGAYLELYTQSAALRAGLANVRSYVTRWAVGLVGTTTAVLAPLASLKLFVNVGDDAAKTARALRVNIRELQAMRYAAGLAGIAQQNFDKALARLSKATANAITENNEYTQSFKMLGIDAREFIGLGLIQQLQTLKHAFESVDPATGLSAAFKMMRYEGARFVNFLQAGDFNTLAAQAEMLGVVMGEDAANAAERLNDAWDRLSAAVKGVSLALGGSLAESAITASNYLTGLIVAFREMVQSSPETVERLMGIGKVLLYVAGIAGALTLGFLLLGTPIGLLTIAVLAFAEAFGLVDTGASDLFKSIRVGGNSLYGWWQYLGDLMADFMLSIWDEIANAFNYMITTVLNGIDRVIKYFHIVSDFVGLGPRNRDEAEALIRERDEKIAARNEEFDRSISDRVAARKARIAARDELFNENASEVTNSPFKGFFDRAKEIADSITAAPGSTRLPENVDLPGIPIKEGVRGFFGGVYGGSQLGEAFAGGTKSTDERQLDKLTSIEDKLDRIRENTESSTVPAYQGD